MNQYSVNTVPIVLFRWATAQSVLVRL